MLGAGVQFNRSRGSEDRFYNSAKARRNYQNQKGQNQLQRAQSDVTVGQCKETLMISGSQEPESPAEKTPRPVALPAFEPVVLPLSNVERFLEAITPSVPAQYLSKTTMRGWRTCDVEFQPYFVLGDLWESFKEWSAYGAGVPLMLNGSDSVIQYYVPYLSGIQIYVDSSKSPLKSRRTSEDSDGDYFSRDSGSDGSSDSEREQGLQCPRGQQNHFLQTQDLSLQMERLTLRDQQNLQQGGFSSDEGESGNSPSLLFEYLEHDPPYSREPLADKICDLAFRFTDLRTLRSCDVLPSSWFSVAWYPIYRIPVGPTLKDMDACFLTYHSLCTPIGDIPGAQSPLLTYPNEMDGIPKISLPVFGLASYKFRGSLWTSNVGSDRRLVHSLLQAADNWLRLLQVNHPDFLFFCRR